MTSSSSADISGSDNVTKRMMVMMVKGTKMVPMQRNDIEDEEEERSNDLDENGDHGNLTT
jgi:hypothetical protein